MATHLRRGLDRVLFGSVAEEVLLGSNLPVLLVRAA
jgi:nucleotide-binding universal stress UspA family protein